ncbi:alpha/beta hydrolase [Methanococcoides orientis]|uniref:alpha/beta fold hydrolase n=1 Tax=Methanococcoides orientis TaxID=2822137 RepID=UPI001E5D1739|nr:alpha/beta hydrolase [Methanococcoides orientis]UGV41699.1 alpha/beta hydrolase [Methanococcoides orientis]
MKLRIDLILTLILITLAFSGCIGMEGESAIQGSSEFSINSSSVNAYSFIDIPPLLECISSNDGLHRESENYDTGEFSIFEAPVKYASVNGIKIAYREFGSGEPILMISPFASTMDMWNATFVEQLAGSYRVIIFDNRGMGYSSDNNSSITIHLLVNDAEGLMNALDLDSANVFGTSMGASIAQELALEYPGKVDRLILSSATYSLDVPETEILRSRIQYRASDPSTDPMIRKYAEGNLGWDGTYERLLGIQKKVLLLTGDKDILTPPELSITITEQVPNSQLVRFEGVGHLGEQYLPEEYANKILCFLVSE